MDDKNKMTGAEITTLIGEFLLTEIDDANNVEYKNETSLVLIMENGKRFLVEVKNLLKVLK